MRDLLLLKPSSIQSMSDYSKCLLNVFGDSKLQFCFGSRKQPGKCTQRLLGNK